MPAVTGETLPEGVYRTDVSDVGLRRWWTSCNTPFVGGYMGVSEYFSILNGDYANAVLNDWALAAAQQGDFSFRGLDGSTVLNTLAGVRYTFVRPGEEGYVPYDYVYVGDTEQSSRFTITPDNGSTLHRYENQHSLPLGFTTDRVISEQDYMALNGLEKQAALMQGVVLGEAALTPMDRLYAKFADAFEEQYINQGFNEDRSIEQTLDLGWKLLSILPRSEMKRIKPELVEKYWPKQN